MFSAGSAFLTEIQNSHTLSIQSLAIAEFNLNDLENIQKIGNYRYRPSSVGSPYYSLTASFDASDVGDFYTDSDISYEEFVVTDDGSPFTFVDKSKETYWSLGDCFLPFRPRSGINKARFINNKYIDNVRSGDRPRYYMPSRSDYFKYWTSYKKEGVRERGISAPSVSGTGGYFIDDVAPFVVYSQQVPANRIVVKMQTNVGSVNLGTIRTSDNVYIDDPLYDYEYASVPRNWKIEVLRANNMWDTVYTFSSSVQVPKDGYVELFYGIKPPAGYENTFDFKGYKNSQTLLPTTANLLGDAYIYEATASAAGTLVVWDGAAWSTKTLAYGWSLVTDDLIKTNGQCTTPVNPLQYVSGGSTIYREFDRIKGIRLSVSKMNAPQTTFDLIELSPRLSVNVSDYTEQFSITKTLAGTDNGLPVGSLTTSNGQISLANIDNAFSPQNTFDGTTGSILYNLMNQNAKFIFYETLLDINGYNIYVPIKTMYADRFVSATDAMKNVDIPLRDLYFRLETLNAPSIFYKDTRLTYAVASLLDYIGFSNYVFRTLPDYNEPTLPYFFVEPDISVAEILQRIAVATQCAMFFDEENNFVMMTKEYLLASEDDRATDFGLQGNDNPVANIEGIEAGEAIILNDGKITYTTRYVQREIATLGSSILLDNERVYRYKPVLLWEVSGSEQTKTINESTQSQSGFALGALALNNTLTASVPYVVNNQVTNNVIDFGESIYWLPRYQGYLYANGEVIRFDGVEYAIPGVASATWISSNKEYQKYFAQLPFNGKIFPTGRVRIFSEPFYEVSGSATVIKNGAVKTHGRGQFDTNVVEHPAGLTDFWSNDSNVRGLRMYSENLFTTKPTEDLTAPTLGTTTASTPAYVHNFSKKSSRNGIIKNFMSSRVFDDGFVNNLKTTNSGTVQSSALVFRGPKSSAVPSSANGGVGAKTNRDFISYIYKDLTTVGDPAPFRHFGTRIRIIGKSDQNFGQVANGSSNYYDVQSENSQDKTSVNGGSGGIAIMVDPTNGSGYYFEICALSDANIDKYAQSDTNTTESVVHNILFYKVNNKVASKDQGNSGAMAMPQKLWGGLSSIIVDAGLFVGQDRLGIAENPTVYDLSIEYETLTGGRLRFYLFINNILIKIVDDSKPLPVKTSAALFVRAGTECMFENFYALDDMITRNQNSTIIDADNLFDRTGVTTNEFMRRYAISGIVQSAYMTNISPSSPLRRKIYFEEFGTIMRECAHFNITYDQAYPAFFSRIAKTFATDRSFTVSGYYGGPYEAEFLVFNSADKAIVLDDSTGTYLRILGVTFTQNTTNELSVDGYFGALSNFSDPEYSNNYLISPQQSLTDFNKIKASRSKYGKRDFSLDSMYIQSEDQARDIMQWLIDKTLKPRQDLTVSVFPMPHLQIGDIVTIDYTSPDNIEFVDPTKRFIIKEIAYSRSKDDISQQLRVVEI